MPSTTSGSYDSQFPTPESVIERGGGRESQDDEASEDNIDQAFKKAHTKPSRHDDQAFSKSACLALPPHPAYAWHIGAMNKRRRTILAATLKSYNEFFQGCPRNHLSCSGVIGSSPRPIENRLEVNEMDAEMDDRDHRTTKDYWEKGGGRCAKNGCYQVVLAGGAGSARVSCAAAFVDDIRRYAAGPSSSLQV